MSKDFTRELTDEAATLAAGEAFAAELSRGQTVYLHGDIGAGKTTFVRGVLRGLGHIGKVKSPTYTLVEPYELLGLTAYHFDLYRFNSEDEWDAAGFAEYFNPASVCFVEWPEKAQNLLPAPDFDIRIALKGRGRSLRVIAHPE